MGFLERAIRKGISDGIGKAVGNAIAQAVEPKATEFVNRTAEHLDSAADSSIQKSSSFSGMEGAFSNLERAAQDFAAKQAENLKICLSCGNVVSAEQKFCPECGEVLPEKTVAQSAVCTSCGKQNNIGMKFCADCGTKLPAAVMEEEGNARKRAAVLVEWQEKLSQYPVWEFEGENLYIDEYDGYFTFGAEFKGNSAAARNAVEKYRTLLLRNGFRKAGQYPSDSHLYKMINGICYHVDLEHCFECGSDSINLAFMTGEPTGGFDYIKPEPKKPANLKGLFKF
ncbi:MAG: zinc ribbon domain-containing protein [Ruminococcaceae bacterium]|nr:zinc ribbon domain-containing protein [Oscillospiraceae bacterium]